MFKSKSTIFAVVVAVVIVIGLWVGVKNKDKTSSVTDSLPAVSLADIGGTTNQTEVAIKPNFLSQIFGGNSVTYRDVSSQFLFEYPKGYTVKEIPAPAEGEARTLLLSKGENAPSIQVAVSPFDEDIVLTIERIQTDVPDLGMKNPQAIDVAGTKGVKFELDAGTNIWFVAKGNLFQLTALLAEATVLDQIVSSFKM